MQNARCCKSAKIVTATLLVSLCVAFSSVHAGNDGRTRAVSPVRLMSTTPGDERSIQMLHLERTTRMAQVEIDLSAFDGTDPRHGDDHGRRTVGSTTRFELFPGEVHEFTSVRIEEGVGGATTWIGANRGRIDNHAVVTFGNGRIYASIDIGRDRYLVESIADGTVIARQLDGQQNGLCATGDHFADDQHDPSKRVMATAAPKPAAPKSVSAHRTIDLMVLYTAEAAASYGYDMSGVVSNLSASLNTAFSNSGVDGAVRVVHYALWSGAPNPNRIFQFRNARNAMISGASPFSGLHSLRDQHGADLVILLTQRPNGVGDDEPTDPGAEETYPACGVAGGADQLPLFSDDVMLGTFDTNKAYAVVAVNCADIDRTFHHELGHNLGGFHDLNTTAYCGFGPTTGGHNGGSSCGYTNAGDGVRTVMGSATLTGFGCGVNSCPRLLRFSNDGKDWVNGSLVDIGTAAASFSQVLDSFVDVHGSNGTVEFVATYRSPPLAVPGSPPGMNVESCFSNHDIDWTPGSGTVGWYEAQSASTPSFSGAFEIYRGNGTWLSVVSGSTFYARVRACNGAGCSGWIGTGPISYTPSCP